MTGSVGDVNTGIYLVDDVSTQKQAWVCGVCFNAYIIDVRLLRFCTNILAHSDIKRDTCRDSLRHSLVL